MIEGLGGPRASRADFRRGSPAGPNGFSVAAGRPATTEAGLPVGSTSAASMDAMLSLQEADPVFERDRSARRHGQAMLGALAALQRALLADGDTGSALTQLSRLAEELPEAADQTLARVLSAIRTRVEVEIARMQP